MKLLLIATLILLGAACMVQADCPGSQQALAQKIGDYAKAILDNCNTGTNFCSDDSKCLNSYLDYLSFLEDCASQLGGNGFDAATIAGSVKAALKALCGNRPDVIAGELFGGCANSQPLIKAITKVSSVCPAAPSGGVCDSGCFDALETYYSELYKCVGVTGGSEAISSFRALLEHNCQLISTTQECYQDLLQNTRNIAIQCSNADCSTSCQNAINAASSASSTNCASEASVVLAQYKATCDAQCGPVVKSDFNDMSTKCSKLHDLTASSDDCNACSDAISETQTDSACFGTSSASIHALAILKLVQSHACSADPIAKDLAGTDIFGAKAARIAIGCRAVGVCNNECAAAIDDFAEIIDDAYGILPVPSDIKTAIASLEDVCDQVVTGYSFRINSVLADLTCDYIFNHVEDIITRFAIIFGVNPASLIVADCKDLSTRAPAADLTMGSKDDPGTVKTSDCQKAGLTCNSVESESEGHHNNGGSSSASMVALSVGSLVSVAILGALLY